MAEAGGISEQELLLHVHDTDFGQRMLVIAVLQTVVTVLSLLGEVSGADIRCRRAKQQKRARLQTAEPGDLARVIARDGFRSVAVLLLLVDDDEPEVGNRGKHRAARANDQLCITAFDAFPFVIALSGGETAVQNGNLFAKP